MQDREHHNALGFDAVEDSVRKARNDCTTHLPMDACKDFWKTLYGVKGGIDFRKKFFARAISLAELRRVLRLGIPRRRDCARVRLAARQLSRDGRRPKAQTTVLCRGWPR